MPGPYLITDEQLDRALRKAAEAGATHALRELGLGDESARRDVAEWRNLLAAWRVAKREILQTFIRQAITVLLIALATGVTYHFWNGKG